jgi:protein-S-isoprenylcysteine O-methyltransferase Ste14
MEDQLMFAIFSSAYAVVAYATFFGTIVYAIGFIGNFVGPKSIDTGAVASPVEALVVNSLLLALFAMQHSVMARPAFKRWWARYVPAPIERSTYVLFASLILLLLFWQWRPLPGVVWTVTGAPAASVLEVLAWAGWGMVFLSTFLISHFELFGLSQGFAGFLERPLPDPAFKTPFLYRGVRHPIYLGFVLAFWATPTMTVGHLLFAAMTTGYILVGIYFEERDLVAQFGQKYLDYRKRVGMLLPRLGAKAHSRSA